MKIEKIISYLTKKDPVLRKIFKRNFICPILEESNLNTKYLFVQLSRTIVGQQLSKKAANSIWNRLAVDALTPSKFIKKIKKVRISQATKFGISKSKLSYIKEILKRIESKEFDFSKLSELNDDEVMGKLMDLKGVGIWSAEMFLMFSLKRKDIFSKRDAGLRRAMAYLYDDNDLTDKKIERIVMRWAPYKSIVCWYLWKALDEGILKKNG